MTIDHGESRGPWPLSKGVDPTLGRRGRSRGFADLGHEHVLRGDTGYGQVVPAYEDGPGMDRGLFWNGSDY